MQSIYQFRVHVGRHGDLSGKFTATEADIAFMVGKAVYFEEPWGRHTGCDVMFDETMFMIISSDPADVETFDRLGMESGHSPLGLLHDSIADGRVELSAAEKEAAPEYFRDAFSSRAGD